MYYYISFIGSVLSLIGVFVSQCDAYFPPDPNYVGLDLNAACPRFQGSAKGTSSTPFVSTGDGEIKWTAVFVAGVVEFVSNSLVILDEGDIATAITESLSVFDRNGKLKYSDDSLQTTFENSVPAVGQDSKLYFLDMGPFYTPYTYPELATVDSSHNYAYMGYYLYDSFSPKGNPTITESGTLVYCNAALVVGDDPTIQNKWEYAWEMSSIDICGGPVYNPSTSDSLIFTTVITSNKNFYVYAINEFSGEIVWQTLLGSIYWTLATNNNHDFNGQTQPVVGNDGNILSAYLVQSASGAQTYCVASKVSAVDGSLLWTSEQFEYGDSLIYDFKQFQVSVNEYHDDGRVYIECGDDMVYSLNSLDGSLEWSVSVNSFVTGSILIDSNGRLYVGTVDGIVVLDSSNMGTTIWSSRLIGSVIGSPSMAADGSILLLTQSMEDDWTVILHSFDGGESVCSPGTAYYNGICRECEPGYFSETGAYCSPCSTGTYASELGMIECRDCPIGKYASEEASASCSSCEEIKSLRNTFPTFKAQYWSSEGSHNCPLIKTTIASYMRYVIIIGPFVLLILLGYLLSSNPWAHFAFSVLPMTSMISHLLFYFNSVFANKTIMDSCFFFLLFNCGLSALILALFIPAGFLFAVYKSEKTKELRNKITETYETLSGSLPKFVPFTGYERKYEDWTDLFSFLEDVIRFILYYAIIGSLTVVANISISALSTIILGPFCLVVFLVYGVYFTLLLVLGSTMGVVIGVVGYELKLLGLDMTLKLSNNQPKEGEGATGIDSNDVTLKYRRIMQHYQSISACLFGSLPQLFLVIANNSESKQWTVFGQFSIIMSSIFLLNTIWKYTFVCVYRNGKFENIPTESDAWVKRFGANNEKLGVINNIKSFMKGDIASSQSYPHKVIKHDDEEGDECDYEAFVENDQ